MTKNPRKLQKSVQNYGPKNHPALVEDNPRFGSVPHPDIVNKKI